MTRAQVTERLRALQIEETLEEIMKKGEPEDEDTQLPLPLALGLIAPLAASRRREEDEEAYMNLEQEARQLDMFAGVPTSDMDDEEADVIYEADPLPLIVLNALNMPGLTAAPMLSDEDAQDVLDEAVAKCFEQYGPATTAVSPGSDTKELPVVADMQTDAEKVREVVKTYDPGRLVPPSVTPDKAMLFVGLMEQGLDMEEAQELAGLEGVPITDENISSIISGIREYAAMFKEMEEDSRTTTANLVRDEIVASAEGPSAPQEIWEHYRKNPAEFVHALVIAGHDAKSINSYARMKGIDVDVSGENIEELSRECGLQVISSGKIKRTAEEKRETAKFIAEHGQPAVVRAYMDSEMAKAAAEPKPHLMYAQENLDEFVFDMLNEGRSLDEINLQAERMGRELELTEDNMESMYRSGGLKHVARSGARKSDEPTSAEQEERISDLAGLNRSKNPHILDHFHSWADNEATIASMQQKDHLLYQQKDVDKFVYDMMNNGHSVAETFDMAGKLGLDIRSEEHAEKLYKSGRIRTVSGDTQSSDSAETAERNFEMAELVSTEQDAMARKAVDSYVEDFSVQAVYDSKTHIKTPLYDQENADEMVYDLARKGFSDDKIRNIAKVYGIEIGPNGSLESLYASGSFKSVFAEPDTKRDENDRHPTGIAELVARSEPEGRELSQCWTMPHRTRQLLMTYCLKN
jgi:hypothetical protein